MSDNNFSIGYGLIVSQKLSLYWHRFYSKHQLDLIPENINDTKFSTIIYTHQFLDHRCNGRQHPSMEIKSNQTFYSFGEKSILYIRRLLLKTIKNYNNINKHKSNNFYLHNLYILLIAIEISIYEFPPTYHKLYLLAKKEQNNNLGILPLEIWHHILTYLDKDHFHFPN